jgi:peptidoglycan/LPS O-acetylase OafA/YrhL
LDGLRAISISIVVLGHLSETRGFPQGYHLFAMYSQFGVRIFFVISGFLITKLLLKEKASTGGISIAQFYVRRAYRILPAAYAYIAIIAVLAWRSLPGVDIVLAFTYLSNYLKHPAWLLGHLWSLSCEEQFYLLWPFLLAHFFSKRLRIVIGACIVAPFIHVSDAFGSLAAGCLLALAHDKFDEYAPAIDRWIVPVALVTMALPPLQLPRGIGPLLTNAGIVLCVHHCIRKQYRLLNTRPVVWLGVLSYSLYLWQQPFLNRSSVSVWTSFPLNLLCALGAACACHYAIEKPFLRLRDSRKASAATSVRLKQPTEAESSPVPETPNAY